MKITLKDIAKDTGLSISTVSRVLNRSGKISSKNVQKVFDSAQRLNYPLQFNSSHKVLRDEIFIAVVTHVYPGDFYSSFFNGFTKAGEGTKVHFGLFNFCHAKDDGFKFVKSLQKNQFDAAVLFIPRLTKSDYQDLLKHSGNFPMVSAAPLATPVMDTVSFDNYSGGHLVAKHFHEKGYRKIGVIQGPSTEIETYLRKNGLVDYCEQAGLEIVWNHKTDYNISSGTKACEDFLSLDEKPDAIFASNDALALGFMHTAKKEGLKIPDDVAIAGYDDIMICEYQNPTLTSVHTPFFELGKSVLELITNQLNEKSNTIKHSGITKLIPVNLIERLST